MEDFSGEIRKNVKAFSMHKPPKSTQTWTLLFIGSHGKTITFRRFKGLFILFMILLFSAIGAAAGLYLLYDSQVKAGKAVKSEAETLRKQLANLKVENEVLMARAILAESKLHPPAADASSKDSKKASEPEKTVESLQPSADQQSAETTMPESQPSESDDEKEDAQKPDKKKSRRNR